MKHIPDFLDYCEVEKGLSDKTQENYQRYLQKFASWLKKAKKTDITPLFFKEFRFLIKNFLQSQKFFDALLNLDANHHLRVVDNLF
ncbi:MAG: site-specific integrase [Candidatus Nealsonbacteria bacterium]